MKEKRPFTMTAVANVYREPMERMFIYKEMIVEKAMT
jgi:hypothetical protein